MNWKVNLLFSKEKKKKTFTHFVARCWLDLRKSADSSFWERKERISKFRPKYEKYLMSGTSQRKQNGYNINF